MLAATADRVQRQLEEVFCPEKALEVKVADSITVMYPKEEQERYAISPYGRKECKDDTVTYVAAPRYVATPLTYQSVDTNMIEESLRYAREGFSRFHQAPVKEMELVESKPHVGEYERALFDILPSPIVLVNPGGTTIWNSRNHNVRIKCEEGDRERIRRHYEKMDRPVPWATDSDEFLIHYYGFHGDTQPRARRWIRFIPSPTAEHHYKGWVVKWDEDGCTLSYSSRTLHHYRIDNETTDNRYNPRTADHILGCRQERYLVECNWNLTDWKDEKIYYGTLNLEGTLPAPNSRGEYYDSEYVWDVPGGGTYMSRRPAIRQLALKLGKRAKPFSAFGKYPINMFTSVLRESVMHYGCGGISVLPIHRRDYLGPDKPVGIIVTKNIIHSPLALCPGLFFTHVRFDPHRCAIDTKEKVFAFCRTLKEVESRLPMIVKHLTEEDIPLLPNSRGPSESWETISRKVEEAADHAERIGSLIKRTAIPLATYGHYLSRHPHYLLICPKVYAAYMNTDRSAARMLSMPLTESAYDYLVIHTSAVMSQSWMDEFLSDNGAPLDREYECLLKASHRHYRVAGGRMYRIT